MGDSEPPSIRPPETITITVLRARNLKGSSTKADAVNAMVKVEFGEKGLGESPKVDCTADTPAEFNYNATMSCTYDDPTALDEIAHKPVVLTVIEVLPKEKKQKEEKTVQLGQCTVDMLPLVKGETKHRYTLVVNPLPGSPLETIPPEAPRPEVDVMLSVNEPLVDNSQLDAGNLMTITVESLFSPPESWTLTGAQYAYAAALPVPVTSEKETPIVFANGALKPGIDKEVPNKQKKWAVPATAQANAIYMPDQFIAQDAIEDEDGDFRGKDDREHRTVAEQEKNRCTWNTERRSYLEGSAVKSFQDKIAKCRYWPLEVMRLPQPASGKGKKKQDEQADTKKGSGAVKDDEGSVSFHGVAFVNLAPLLYPGVKRIRGAYKIYSYTDQALYEKTKRKVGLGEEAARIANNILNRSTASPGPKKGGGGGKDDKKEKDAKKGGPTHQSSRHSRLDDSRHSKVPGDETRRSNSIAQTHDSETSQTIKSDAGSEHEAQAPVNLEGQQYVDSKSYIMFEICLTKPLIPKRPPEELARRVAEYIPPRPLFPKRTDGAQRAVDDFHTQVSSVAGLILDEFRDMFGDDLKTDENLSQEAMEARRQKLIYELNASGKYFAFKEQLKHSVVKIVREKYLKTTNFEDRQELQTFLSELYVYLIDQMHESLTKTLSLEDQAPVPAPLTDSEQLKHFAREAEVNGNFELATKYYQERIARNRNDPSHWFDYGTFCLYINDITKAEECFKECVAIDQKHLHGLLLFGVVCTLQEKHEAAETFFEAATCVQPKSILAWTMLGLFYDAVQNEIGAEMAYIEANKLNQQAAVNAARALKEEELAKQRVEHSESEASHKDDQGGLAPPTSNTLVPDIKQPTPPSSERGQGSARSSEKVSSGRRPSASKRSSAVSEKLEYQIIEGEGVEEGVAISVLSEKPPSADKSHVSHGDSRETSKTGRNKSDSNLSRPSSEYRRGSARGTPQMEEASEETPPREPTPVPTSSIYMQAIDWLLEVKAVPFTERALAHELLSPMGGLTAHYHIALARVKLQKSDLKEAEESLNEALQFDYQNPDVWALMGHVMYLLNDTTEARSCYERTIDFVADASEMHSVYLRLGSIYLRDEKFQEAKNTFLMACKRSPSCVSWLGVGMACYRLGELAEAEDALSEANILNNSDPEVWGYLSLVCLKTGRQLEAEQAYKYAIKVNLEDTDLLDEIIRTQQEAGFGNPQF
ncbi:cilia- and flagella-associated protein 70-like isoform X9 [Mercenaria mercenaria]|uniref:cilia- and flagella-associated protein 70-like isoform X9 n=1 Tax=Mercenaria mercenaria TaxID=6596 RepID=UPI00234F8D1F|nr:cilia- and flagella-associated protein 70-like isoform X9 [Mercenaria mercenaria]